MLPRPVFVQKRQRCVLPVASIIRDDYCRPSYVFQCLLSSARLSPRVIRFFPLRCEEESAKEKKGLVKREYTQDAGLGELRAELLCRRSLSCFQLTLRSKGCWIYYKWAIISVYRQSLQCALAFYRLILNKIIRRFFVAIFSPNIIAWATFDSCNRYFWGW